VRKVAERKEKESEYLRYKLALLCKLPASVLLTPFPFPLPLPFPGLFPGSPVGVPREVVGGELDPDPADPEARDGVVPDVEPLGPLEMETEEVEEVPR
jgi:hypothetical protein